MSHLDNETLSINVLSAVPKTFIRGQTLEFLMELPEDVPVDYFNNTVSDGAGGETKTATTPSSKLRRLENAGTDGLIATLTVTWEANTNSTKLRFKANDTADWPLGPAEFDVVFVKQVGPYVNPTFTPNESLTKTYRSLPVRITITDGVT